MKKAGLIILAGLFLYGCGSGEKKAPIIPMEKFFRNPEKTNFKLSPDGNRFSYLKPYKNRLNIFIKSINGKDSSQATTAVNRDIKSYFWANNKRLIYFLDDNGDNNYNVFAVDINGENNKKLTDFSKATSWIIDELHQDKDRVLIASNLRNPKIFDVYKLNISTGNLKLVVKNPGNVTRWLADRKGNIRIAVKTDGVNSSILYRKSAGEKFKELFTTNFKDEFNPLFFSFDNKYVFAVSNIGRDKSAIVKYNPDRKRVENIVFKHSEADARRMLMSRKEKKIIGVEYTTWKSQYFFFDDDWKKLFSLLKKKSGSENLRIVSLDDSENKLLLKSFSDKSLGAYFYYNKLTKEFKKLTDVSPWLNERNMASMKPVWYRSADGVTINGYLTLPKGSKAQNLPAVIYPHGGPWYRNSWGFDRVTQFFANRGYAVLQMNYRGSTGYGRKFFEAGFKQWGGRIQDDIRDGVRWLIRQGIADSTRIGIYGYSFGGYSALMGVIRYPKMYKCAVDYAGITNLFTFLKTVPPYWKPFREMIDAMVGNPDKDWELLKEASPIYHVKEISAPLFIAAGAKDRKSDINETNKFVEKLKAEGKKVFYMVKENEGHGFGNQENKFEFYRQVEKFLSKNLGGRISN